MSADRIAAIFGTFDVSNFGDLLFPVVAASRLAPFGWTVMPVSPTAAATAFRDALPVHALADLPRARGTGAPDAILIGGGEIIHDWPADFLREYQHDDVSRRAYLSLWFGAAVMGALLDAPIVWNAPGMPVPLNKALRARTLAPVLAASDYVSVRDQTSAIFLGAGPDTRVVPDTVADLARVWPKPMLAEHYRTFVARKGLAPDARILAVHVRPTRLTNGEIGQVGQALGDFARTHGLTPVLLSIGPSLHDGDAVRDLSRVLNVAHHTLDDPLGLREMAAVLAHAALYVGNSMHGYITAAAYDVPGVIVARPGFRKYAGFATHIGREADIVRDWHKWLPRATQIAASPIGRLIPLSVHTALDDHWATIAAVISDRAAGADRRNVFLRRILSDVLGDRGLAWLTDRMPASAVAPGSST